MAAGYDCDHRETLMSGHDSDGEQVDWKFIPSDLEEAVIRTHRTQRAYCITIFWAVVVAFAVSGIVLGMAWANTLWDLSSTPLKVNDTQPLVLVGTAFAIVGGFLQWMRVNQGYNRIY